MAKPSPGCGPLSSYEANLANGLSRGRSPHRLKMAGATLEPMKVMAKLPRK